MTSPSDCMAFIPAKGTSRRLPGKNTRRCAGISLVQRAVDCAKAAGIFSETWVSTEDAGVWWSLNPPKRGNLHFRDPILSADGMGVAAVVAAWLGSLHTGENPQRMPDSFCVLWPTSPLRTPEILREMWAKFRTSREGSLHSATLIDFGTTHRHEGTAIFLRTQYFLQRLSLDLQFGDLTHRISDEYVCDVNTPEDLAEAERRLLAREAACPSS